MKILTKNEQQDWLEENEHFEKWAGNADKFTAKERRILITYWVGKAFEKLQTSPYEHAKWRCFERTGCLITADGSEDEKIMPEGMPDYVVPRPLPTMIIENPFECVVPEPIPPDNEFGREEDENADVVNLSYDVEDDVDEEAYRDLNHNLVGCKITAFYLEQKVYHLVQYAIV